MADHRHRQLLAYAKLAEEVQTCPLPVAEIVNRTAAAVSSRGRVCSRREQLPVFIVILVLSLVLGVLAVIPIGGADMPVVISFLNSYSGLAACAAGFIIQNSVLMVAGCLVGASGVILTKIMCKAMNRSLANVFFAGFGATAPSAGSEGRSKAIRGFRLLRPGSGHSVVLVPGYGMAVAQAQHVVRELATLQENGADVRYAIHPVAGRMPVT